MVGALAAIRSEFPTVTGLEREFLSLCFALAIQAKQRTFVIRGMKVILSNDLAELYGVAPGALNRAVKRNAGRFPKDLVFQLSKREWTDLKCQIGTSSSADVTAQTGIQGWGGSRAVPYAFTEWICGRWCCIILGGLTWFNLGNVMAQINLHDAKTHLSRLVEAAAKGEEIVIAKAGKPMARLVPLRPSTRKERKPGALKGKIWVAEDFDAPMTAEEQAAWNKDPIFPATTKK